MTTTPRGHVKQGPRAFESGGIQIGDVTVQAGAGAPSGVYVAIHAGDIYVDTTAGAMYVASATGSGSWVSNTAAPTASGGTIGGTAFSTGAGVPGAAVPARIGDVYFDYTNGVLYIAYGTSAGNWHPFPTVNAPQPTNTAVVQTYSTVVLLATLQAGATILPAVTGYAYTIIGYKISTASGTPAGSGNFILEDDGATQTIVTASVAQLAAASTPGAAICDNTYTLATIGAYTGKKLTAAHGVIFPAMASLTGPYTMQIQVEYILTT